MYELVFEKIALNFLNKLDEQIKNRIWNKLQKCKEEPFRYLEHLTDIKGYKLRVGNYRIILDIDVKNKIIYILKIGHRKNIYG
ncbi:MAG: type II toxin-antitoxin system RelE/ParE family toxin [Nanoarchaeota archaeon]